MRGLTTIVAGVAILAAVLLSAGCAGFDNPRLSPG
jgi:hypothetical protein